MRIKRAIIENFRLLRNVEIGFEDRTTLIVGRNNSGKTSIAELWTCNGFAPVTDLITPPWPRMRAG